MNETQDSLTDAKERSKGNARYERFIDEMEQWGGAEQIYWYRGRFYYEGPAADIASCDYQDAIRATSMRLQRDSMGRDGLVVYPE